MSKDWQGLEYLTLMLAKYNNSTDAGRLEKLRRGELADCDCSVCKFVATYYFLVNGGKFTPAILEGLDEVERDCLLKVVCLRAVDP